MQRAKKLLAWMLVLCTMMSICAVPASASSIADGSQTCTVQLGVRNHFLVTTEGTTLRAGNYTYITNDGLSGPAYCIDHGLDYTDKVLPITGKYSASPATAGAFANGYPQLSVETFLGLHLANNAILSGLTEAEFGYATQVAVWATLGQLGVDGTSFVSGREYLNPPSGDAQQARVFRAAQLILEYAKDWDRVYQTGMYIRINEDELGGNVAIPPQMSLEFAADQNLYGIKQEMINGKPYYTKEYIFASATSTYYNDYSLELWGSGCPMGTIFTDMNNVELTHSDWRGRPTWRVPTTYTDTYLNGNGFEYSAHAKMCIPVEAALTAGEITVQCAAQVMQYEIFLAENTSNSEQSYIIADPSKGQLEADAVLSWGGPVTLNGSLVVTKVDGGGIPLAGAVFDLDGTDGSHRTGTTNAEGRITWEMLDPAITYTLTEKEPPPGFGIVEPITLTVRAGHVEYQTVQDTPLRTLTLRKIDRQSGYSLRGAIYSFEQMDGTYKTTATTDHAGLIQFDAERLPIGNYKIYEVQAPEGYELDPTPQMVYWDGLRDITLTFKDTRKPTLIISKQDSRTKYNLPGASFAVTKNGSPVTTVTTNDNGLAYVSGLTSGYYEVREVTAPQGYSLNDKVYGVNIAPYDPATEEDPRLVIENDPLPSLRILKYDRETMKPLEGTTFKVYKDASLIGDYVTDKNGEILLTGLQPGTYAVEEINSSTHVADAPPQQIELAAGRMDTATLIFLNDPKPGIHILKVDADTLQPLKGATFLVSQVGGSYHKELQTDANGEIDLTALEPGTYTCRETIAPAGYTLDDAIRTFQIRAGQNAQFVFADHKLSIITLTKQDASGQAMAGVSFSLTPVGDGAHSDERTTNAQGVITWEGLEPGLYSLVETATKSTHVLDTTEHHVRVNAGQDAKVVLVNYEKPSLKITKYDRASHTPMVGVTFEVFKDTTSLGRFQTDAKGIILLDHIDPGTYKAVEVDTGDDAHLLTTMPQEVELHAGDGVRELVFFNEKLPGIHLVKVDSQTMQPLAGATFRITQVGGSYQQEYTTGEDGEIDLSKLEPAVFEVREIKAPGGYVMDNGSRTIRLVAGEDAQFIFTNTTKPDLKIIKTDAVSGKPVEGVTFTVKQADGRTITTLASDAKGEVLLEDMAPGVVEIWEQSVPNTYILNEEHQLISLVPGQLTTVHFQNNPKLSLRIVKYDQQSGKPLEGTTFQVYKDAAPFGTYTTDANGEILLTGLEPGTYLAQEVAAPDTHVVNSSPQQVELVEGRDEIVTLVFFNTLKPGIHLVKVDSQTMKPLPGATYRITKVGGSLKQEYTTGEDGEIDLSKLEPGTYQVQETKAPEGYLMDDGIRTVEVKAGENALFVFTDTRLPNLTLTKRDDSGKAMEGVTFSLTPMGEGAHSDERSTNAQGEIVWKALEPGLYSLVETATRDTHVLDTTEHHVQIEAGKDATIEIVNYEKPSLKITKYDRASHQPMVGVTFEVFRDTQSIGKFETDANGAILLDHVDPGTYKAVEIDVGNDTHILTTTPQEIELRAGDGVRELVFFNDRLPGLHLVKVDSADLSTPIANARFRFVSVLGDYGPVELTTGEDGTIDLSKLPVGSYVVTELECPGYIVDDAQRIIHLDGNETGQFVFTNTKLPVLKLTKTSADGTPMEGVTFRIAYVEDGTHYMDRTTDANGEIIMEGLQPGVLSIVETATLPDHILDTTEHHVELQIGQVATIALKNDRRPNLTIHKVDADTDEPVPGTIFLIKKPDGHTVAEATTGQDGSVTVPNLLPGVYEISEKSVPSPYLLDAPAQTTTLYANHDSDVTFRNHKKPSLTVNKVDSITGDPIQGAKFHVTYASNNTNTGEINDLGDFYSDETGKFIITDLRDGWYRVEELEPARGYAIKDSAVQEVYIAGGESKVLTFRNVPLSALVVFKYDSVTGEAVPNAVFQVKYLGGTSGTGGTVIGTYRTSVNGSFTVTALQAGNYIVEELASDSNHVIDTAPQTAYISGKEQDVVQLYFGNSPKGALLVKKVDAATNEPLSDVEFLITTSDGLMVGDANGKFVTDSTGSFTVSGITPGTTLVVKETRAKDGYLLDDAAQSAQIKAGQTVTLEFRNRPVGSLLVKKVDAATNEPLSNVEFMVTTSDGTVVGNANGKFVTDSSGSFTVGGINPGTTLVVKETRAKDGYLLDDVPQTIQIKSNETVTLEFRNQPLGGLIIHKLDSVTNKPLSGVQFKITYADGKVVDNGRLSSNGLYTTNKAGQIVLYGITGTLIVTEIKTIPGYTIDESTRSQTVVVNPNDTQTLTFYNVPIGGVEIVKVNAADKTERIPNTTFEIRRVSDGGLVDTVTTGSRGRVYLSLEDGSYYAVEVECPKEFKLDPTPHYFTVKSGESTTLTVANQPYSGIIIHKMDSVTGKGIYGVKFLVYDANKTPLGEYTSDNQGYVYIDDLITNGRGLLYIRELEAAPGYELDKEYKTVYVQPGKTIEVDWVNTPVTGQIQVYKFATEYNEITGAAAGTPLQGAVYEISDPRSGAVVDYITTDARGIAASKPLPLGRYKIREVTAPAYWQIDDTVFDETLEYSGQIIKLSAYDKPAKLGVSITKRSNTEVLAGNQMRYDFTIANTSNVALESFFWHDRIPTDIASATVLTTGTYSARLNYRILYKTNFTADYQVLASNLLTSNNYSFSLNAIPQQAGEVVTDVYFDFGKVPVGFQSVAQPTLTVQVSGTATNGYQLVNRANVGGKYQDTWQTAQASWVTVIRNLTVTPPLPKTGY